MKEVVAYQCEVCHTIHSCHAEAYNCEIKCRNTEEKRKLEEEAYRAKIKKDAIKWAKEHKAIGCLLRHGFGDEAEHLCRDHLWPCHQLSMDEVNETLRAMARAAR